MRVQVLDLSNEIHNLNILERAIMLGGESWLDGGVVVENIGAAHTARSLRPDPTWAAYIAAEHQRAQAKPRARMIDPRLIQLVVDVGFLRMGNGWRAQSTGILRKGLRSTTRCPQRSGWI